MTNSKMGSIILGLVGPTQRTYHYNLDNAGQMDENGTVLCISFTFAINPH
jgi:hypothetical protein